MDPRRALTTLLATTESLTAFPLFPAGQGTAAVAGNLAVLLLWRIAVAAPAGPHGHPSVPAGPQAR